MDEDIQDTGSGNGIYFEFSSRNPTTLIICMPERDESDYDDEDDDEEDGDMEKAMQAVRDIPGLKYETAERVRVVFNCVSTLRNKMF